MIRLINRSAHDTGLPDESVHMIATSPPYWGLRAYTGEQGVGWPAVDFAPMPGLDPIHIPAMRCDLGLEPTPEAYIGHLILVMREMWRVLRDDGVAFVNLGDSYASQGGNHGGRDDNQNGVGAKIVHLNGGGDAGNRSAPAGLKPKDLCLITARFALAAQADGWWVRSDIIWAKPNPMPESVTDRPTKAHEYIYLLSKSARYFYDHVAIKEQGKEWAGRAGTFARNGAVADHVIPNQSAAEHRADRTDRVPQGRNRRTVWTVATRPYSGAHFATWPPDLVRPMIRAGTSARGVCPECGAPWARVVEHERVWTNKDNGTTNKDAHLAPQSMARNGNARAGNFETTTTGWAATCPHADLDPIPATVLDPFSGSGTTGMVAIEEGREYIGVDISQEYLDTLAPDRLTAQIGLRL